MSPILVTAAPAKADVSVQAEVLARTATELFKLKQFEKAAQLFMQAYGKSRKAALVYNAARAYEEAGKLGDAAALFRLYMTIADDPDGIAEARERIKSLEARANALTHPAEAGTLPPAPSPPAAPPQGLPTLPLPPTPTQQPDQSPVAAATVPAAPLAADPHRSRAWAWVATGGSLALLGGGAALVWLGSEASREANRIPVQDAADVDAYNKLFDRADKLELSGVVALGVGLAVGGLAVWRHLAASAEVVAGTDGRGLWVAGRW